MIEDWPKIHTWRARQTTMQFAAGLVKIETFWSMEESLSLDLKLESSDLDIEEDEQYVVLNISKLYKAEDSPIQHIQRVKICSDGMIRRRNVI